MYGLLCSYHSLEKRQLCSHAAGTSCKGRGYGQGLHAARADVDDHMKYPSTHTRSHTCILTPTDTAHRSWYRRRMTSTRLPVARTPLSSINRKMLPKHTPAPSHMPQGMNHPAHRWHWTAKPLAPHGARQAAKGSQPRAPDTVPGAGAVRPASLREPPHMQEPCGAKPAPAQALHQHWAQAHTISLGAQHSSLRAQKAVDPEHCVNALWPSAAATGRQGACACTCLATRCAG